MDLLGKFRQGLVKTRSFLNQGMKQIRQAFSGNDEDLLEELEMLFLQADIGQACTERLLDALKTDMKQKRCYDQNHIDDVLRDSMLEVLGPSVKIPEADGKLLILLMVGVNGAGKTTTAGKLALRYKQAGKKVMLAAADTFRAAAVEQLRHWAEQTQVDIIAQACGADPAAVTFDAIRAAKSRGTDVLLIDTAGRLHNKRNLMDELGKIRRIIGREAADAQLETLLVLDATTGQNALMQAEAFTEAVRVTGLVITKLDGNAKGGVTLAVADRIHLPIYLAGLGESAEDLVDFDPSAFVSSLLPQAIDQSDSTNGGF